MACIRVWYCIDWWSFVRKRNLHKIHSRVTVLKIKWPADLSDLLACWWCAVVTGIIYLDLLWVVSGLFSPWGSMVGNQPEVSCHYRHDCALAVYISNCTHVLWCGAEGWRHWWILQTTLAPECLIHVCLHRDLKLVHVDFGLMVLRSWLASSTEGRTSQLWGNKAFY